VEERKVVLDASALLAWVLKERGHETVYRLLPFGVITAPNLIEVLTRAVSRGHTMAPGHLHGRILDTGLHVESVTDDDVARATELILASRALAGEGSLSLGDALCLACAERLKLTVTGGDQLWELLDLNVAYMPFR
jgi:PIN domain nuclease of toxin-antitoxin system